MLPADLTNIAALADLNLERFGEQPALVVDDRTLSNEQMLATSRRLASALLDRGVEADERVGVYLDNCVELLWAYQAISAIGATVVPLMASLRADEVRTRLAHCEARTLLTTRAQAEAMDRTSMPSLQRVLHAEQLEALAGAHPPLAAVAPRATSDLAFVLYTGATTSAAKGVMQTHANLLANVRNNAPLNQGRRDLAVLPMAHTFGVGLWLSNYLMGGSVVLMLGGFEAERALRLIEQHRIERMVAVPSMLLAMLEHPAADEVDVSSMKVWATGGAPFDAAQAARFSARFPGELLGGYGLTEACPTIARDVAGQPQKPGASGRVVPGVTVRICDPESGEALDAGATGEICAKGDNISPGYLEMPEETARVFRDGWLHTGDLGRLDDDGYLYVVGRVKDLIIQGGLNIYPAEVELALAQHDGVARAAVVGRDDDLVGEVVVAFVTAAEGAELDETSLRAWCAERLAPYKVPSAIHVIDELPLTELGKVDKNALRAAAQQQHEQALDAGASAAVAAGDEVLSRLCTAFATVLELEAVAPDDNFFELGGTSLQVTRLVGIVREQLDPSLELRTFFEAPSAAALAEKLASQPVERPCHADVERGSEGDAGGDGDARFVDSGLDEAQRQRLAEMLGSLDSVVQVHRLTAGQLNAAPHLVDERQRVDDELLRGSLMRMHMTIHGELDVDAWRQAWQRLLDTHDALRSIVVHGDLPHPVQVVFERGTLLFDEIDVRDRREDQRQAFYADLRGRCTASAPPWIDVQLVRVSDQGYLQACDYHMALIDGFALREMRIDLFTEYANVLAGKGKSIAPRPPVADYIRWLYAQDIAAAERFWIDGGRGVSVAAPTNRPRSGEYTCEYPPEAEAILNEHARELQVPAALLMLGAWALCFGNDSQKDDLVVALMDSGRNAAVDGITEMVGSFSHRLPLRLDLSNKQVPLRAWLRDMQLQIADMQAHEHVLTQQRLRSWWNVEADHLPFDIGMNLQHMQPIEYELATAIPPTISWFFTNHPRWPTAPINLSVWFSGRGMNFIVAYDTVQYTSAQIEALAQRFISTVEAIIDDADDRLQDVIDKIDDFD